MEVLVKEIKFFLSDPFLFGCGFLSLIVIIMKWHALDRKSRTMGKIVITYYTTFIICGQLGLYNIYSSWIYNLMYMPLSYFMWKLFRAEDIKPGTLKIQKVAFWSICALHIINVLFFQGIIYIATITMMLFQVFNAVLAFFYLKYRLENYDEPVHKHILNWFAFAVIIDNIVSIPTAALLSKEMFELIGPVQFKLLNQIQSFLYSCWYLITAAGILWNTTSLNSRFSSSSS